MRNFFFFFLFTLDASKLKTFWSGVYSSRQPLPCIEILWPRYCRIPLSKMKLNSDSATSLQGSCLHVMGTCQSLYAIKILLSFSMCEKSQSHNRNMQKNNNQIKWCRPLDYVWITVQFAAVYCCNFAEGPLNLNFSTQETLIRYQVPWIRC